MIERFDSSGSTKVGDYGRSIANNVYNSNVAVKMIKFILLNLENKSNEYQMKGLVLQICKAIVA